MKTEVTIIAPCAAHVKQKQQKTCLPRRHFTAGHCARVEILWAAHCETTASPPVGQGSRYAWE